MKHRVGLLGLGMIGSQMLGEFLVHPDFGVALCWDLNPEIRRTIRERYPEVDMAEGAEQLITDARVDVVYIGTPPVTHIPLARQALASGKAIFCEKPLAIDLAASRKLVRDVEARGVPSAMNFVYGAGPVVAALEERLSAGHLGEPTGIEVRYEFPSWPLPNQLSAAGWITRRAEGGLVREMFSHVAYLIHRLLGPLTVRWARVHYPADPELAETFVLAHLESAGIPVWLMGGVGGPAAPRRSEWTIHGTRRSLRLQESGSLLEAAGGPWTAVKVVDGGRSAVSYRLDELTRRLDGGETRLPDLRAGLEVQEVVEAILRA